VAGRGRAARAVSDACGAYREAPVAGGQQTTIRIFTVNDGEASEGCGGCAECVRSFPTTTDVLPHWVHQEEQGTGQDVDLSVLSQSEKVSDSLQGRPTGATLRRLARSRATAPREYATCCREGQALAHHACGSRRRTRRLDTRRRHAGRGHRVRKEQSYATQRCYDTWRGSHRA
jgi:hypothetical protein